MPVNQRVTGSSPVRGAETKAGSLPAFVVIISGGYRLILHVFYTIIQLYLPKI